MIFISTKSNKIAKKSALTGFEFEPASSPQHGNVITARPHSHILSQPQISYNKLCYTFNYLDPGYVINFELFPFVIKLCLGGQ